MAPISGSILPGLAISDEMQGVVTGWARWHGIRYLQRQNPPIPGIPEKLEPPAARTSLTTLRRIWAALLEISAQQEPFRCVYSNAVLTPEWFVLDHVLR